MLHTHDIAELEPDVFHSILEPCSVAVLPYVLAPDFGYVWLVEYAPNFRVGWSELPVPLNPSTSPQVRRVRELRYDLQVPTEDFLQGVLPQIAPDAGLVLLQLDRPVPDTLRYRRLAVEPARYDILRRNGWRLTFELPHGGEHASLTVGSRSILEAILREPVIAGGKLTGELP